MNNLWCSLDSRAQMVCAMRKQRWFLVWHYWKANAWNAGNANLDWSLSEQLLFWCGFNRFLIGCVSLFSRLHIHQVWLSMRPERRTSRRVRNGHCIWTCWIEVAEGCLDLEIMIDHCFKTSQAYSRNPVYYERIMIGCSRMTYCYIITLW